MPGPGLTASERNRLRRLIGELAPEPTSPPASEVRLVEDLGYHSLALAELALAIGGAFDIEVENDASALVLPEAATVDDLEDLVFTARRVGR